MRRIACLALGLVLASSTGCMSAYKQMVSSDPTVVFRRIYFTDINVAWQSVLEALKALPLDLTNREAGYIQTKYAENTSQKNFTEAFGNNADTFLKAQYRLKITVASGFYQRKDRPSVKVTVQKEQLIQRDVLEGWKSVESDSVEENTLLYRIGRIIAIRQRLTKLDEEKTRKEVENTEF